VADDRGVESSLSRVVQKLMRGILIDRLI